MGLKYRDRVVTLALVTWLSFLVAAVGLSAVRENVLTPVFQEQIAHVLGTLAFICVIMVITWAFVKKVRGPCRSREFWLIGLMWTIMTVAFEFLFFHFAIGIAWETLLADYNLFAGRLWVLVLLTTLCGPAVVNRWLAKDRP